ncbi:MAG TPA: DUF3189 family protein [Syntrophomonadaceae bacterium]|nr:DUF3189 family protein [Syntrophomonadaceae bacterium]
MNYLFAGKSGVFETIIAALVFLDRDKEIELELEKTSLFGDIEEDNKRELIFVDYDRQGNKVYTLGTPNYMLVNDISTELCRVAGLKHMKLQVIEINLKGMDITYYLSRLGKLPLIGSWFISLAKIWVIYRKDQIIKECKKMPHPKKRKSTPIAAKPIK